MSRRPANPLPPVHPDDHRIARIVAMLRSADGPLGLADFLDAGIVEPAHRLHELELAGYRVERVAVAGDGPRAIAFQLVSEPVRVRERIAAAWHGRLAHP